MAEYHRELLELRERNMEKAGPTPGKGKHKDKPPFELQRRYTGRPAPREDFLYKYYFPVDWKRESSFRNLKAATQSMESLMARKRYDELTEFRIIDSRDGTVHARRIGEPSKGNLGPQLIQIILSHPGQVG